MSEENYNIDEGYSLGAAKYPKELEGHATHDVHYKPMIGAKRKVGQVVAYPTKGGRDIEYASGSTAKNDPHYTSGHKNAEDAFKELKKQKPHQEVKEEHMEESTGSETLKPMGGSGGGESKAQVLATFTSLLAQLGKEDLTNLFNDSIKKYTADGVPSATAPGKTGLGQMPMDKALGAVKEDVAEMFEGEDLTEEFKERATTIFEAVIEARLVVEQAHLEEAYEEALAEEVETIREDMTTKIDKYLDYVVEQWIEENRLAVESSIRTNIAEDFMNGLRNLFAESYITVPEDKVDVLGELNAQIDSLQAELDESVNKQLELQAVINEAEQEATFDEVSEGLAATQVEKLRTLAEGIDFNDAASYSKKLNIIKEKYFSDKKASSTNLINEEVETGAEPVAQTSAGMSQYVSAISRSLK